MFVKQPFYQKNDFEGKMQAAEIAATAAIWWIKKLKKNKQLHSASQL